MILTENGWMTLTSRETAPRPLYIRIADITTVAPSPAYGPVPIEYRGAVVYVGKHPWVVEEDADDIYAAIQAWEVAQ